MRACLTLFRRELGSFFVSWSGYIVVAAAAFLTGLSFYQLLEELRETPVMVPAGEMFFSLAYFWIIQLLAVPLITMRLFAQEKATGTFETLMTAPVSEAQVVLAKYGAAMVFYFLMWLPLAACLALARHLSPEAAALDLGATAGAVAGLALLGANFVAIGCFASALTRNQIVAAMISFAGMFGLFLLNYLARQVELKTSWSSQPLYCLSMVDQMEEMARGMIDTRAILFHLSLALFFLFLTLRVVESRRWKS